MPVLELQVSPEAWKKDIAMAPSWQWCETSISGLTSRPGHENLLLVKDFLGKLNEGGGVEFLSGQSECQGSHCASEVDCVHTGMCWK